MYEIPLFPVHAVLFPGTPLHLHVFEDRYKRMIRHCLEAHQLFGLVLIRSGAEARGPLPEPYSIGCTAQIRQVQHLDEGRMNIIVQGQGRFRILRLNDQDQPYLVGRVEPYPLVNPNPASLQRPARQLREVVKRYLSLLIDSGNSQYNLEDLPYEPVSLAYTALALVRLSLLQKQQQLSIERAGDLLENLVVLYRREVVLVKTMLAGGYAEQGSFSLN